MYFDTATLTWGFFDESEAYWYGNFQTEDAARVGLKYYCDNFL